MDARQIRLVQDSFEKVAPLGVKVAEIFYAELFAIDPSLRSMFRGNLQEQHAKLLSALAMVVRGLNAPQMIKGAVEGLAKRHVGYGVKPEHYTYVGNALLRTLKKGFGADFTPELREAWIAAFSMLARLMKDAAYGPSPAMGGTANRPNAA